MTEYPGVQELLLRFKDSKDLSLEDAAAVEMLVTGVADQPLVPELAKDAPAATGDPSTGVREEGIRVQIGKMSVPEKVKAALLGNATCRGLLIRDPNRMVQLVVLQNPRMTPGEIEEFSKNANLSDAVLRAIADNKNHIKSYTVKFHLVTNPKTPIDVSLKWLPHLRTGELRKIAKSKNLPQVVATGARKRLEDMDK